MTSRSSATEKV